MPDTRPNILLITTDQQRFDTIHRLGNRSIFTPHLNYLVDGGVAFTRCYADAPVCVPSRNTIMTGRHGYAQGLTTNARSPIPMAENPTIPSILTRHGYQTRAVGKMHFQPPRAHYGFEHMVILEDYYRQMARAGHPQRPMDHGVGQNEIEPVLSTVPESLSLTRWIVDQSVDFLETRDPNRPFFCWTSFSKPHPPWDADPNYWALYDGIDLPEPVRGDWSARPEDVPVSLSSSTRNLNNIQDFSPQQRRAAARAYYACITQIDYNLGILLGRLRELGQLERTWIIFTADHGEMLGDHHLGAKSVLLEGSAHVPMIVRPASTDWEPHDSAGSRCDSLVSLADILPTCLVLAGAEVPADVDGRDLLATARGENRRTRLLFRSAGLYCIADDTYKYHFSANDGAELLFDLRADPYECRDLVRSAQCPEVLGSMRRQMAEFLSQQDPSAVSNGLPTGKGKPTHPRSRWPGLHTRAEKSDVLH